jgi:cytidylate kinase
MKSEAPVITLDGPSGTGKGTICYMLAQHLKWHVLDSGSIYRVLAYAAKKNGISFTEIDQLVVLAHALNVKFEADPNKPDTVMLDGENVFDFIRSEQCGQDASVIAVIPQVREALLARQRAFATSPGLVTDGRDMGTIVFPDAVLKIFLYASAEERAKRRYFQLKQKGIDVSLPQVVDELIKRDSRDSGRLHAPLKPAEDAICVDTTDLTIEQVFQVVQKLTREHLF